MIYEAIVMGSSAGGLNALQKVLSRLPGDFRIPILVVQHVHAQSDSYLVRHLKNLCALTIKEAEEKELISGGTVYIAPANYHLLVDEDHTLCLSTDEKVNYSRPSIDVLFETAADVYREKLVGIILTGANEDGTQGMKKIKRNGGLLIVQDPASAESAHMPAAVVRQMAVDYILPLSEIAPFLERLDKQKESQSN
jgi:two-component system, chemotaxis family, protein-glutamate methylesterase/glutaminase